jgi:hypothetical protein
LADKFCFSRQFKLTDLMILKKRNNISESVRCPVRDFVMEPLSRSRATQYREPPARYVFYPMALRESEWVTIGA